MSATKPAVIRPRWVTELTLPLPGAPLAASVSPLRSPPSRCSESALQVRPLRAHTIPSRLNTATQPAQLFSMGCRTSPRGVRTISESGIGGSLNFLYRDSYVNPSKRGLADKCLVQQTLLLQVFCTSTSPNQQLRGFGDRNHDFQWAPVPCPGGACGTPASNDDGSSDP